jgi:hypothetical protein
MPDLQRINPLVQQPQPIVDGALPRPVLLRKVVHPTLERRRPLLRRRGQPLIVRCGQ